MANSDKKKYNKMENILNYINGHFVTVSDEDIKKANPLLKYVIDTIIKTMKEVSPLFNSLYESVYYGGSYYDGLKVGKPEEFDIDLRLVLPKLLNPTLNTSNQPGFVTVHLPGWATFEKSSEYPKYKGLSNFKDEKDYLMVTKVLPWMESTVNLALNKIGKIGNKARIQYGNQTAEIALKKSGPAVTLLINCGDINMDVDLVAVFKLTADQWPPSPFLSFNSLPPECKNKKEFLIVPKTPKDNVEKKERCWRLSFQEQEKKMIEGNNTCKPALRLIKKLRDTQNHTMISSYFIKTVFLHEIQKQEKEFWSSPLSYIFMHMLKKYRDHLQNYNIPYFWNTRNDLLKYIDRTTIDNFKNYLNRVIDAVDKKIDENPYVIAEFLLTSTECKKLKSDMLGNTNSTSVPQITNEEVPKESNNCDMNPQDDDNEIYNLNHNDTEESLDDQSMENSDVKSHYSYSSAYSDYSASCTTKSGINDLQEQYESRSSSSESDIESHYSYFSASSDYSVSCTTRSGINDLQEQHESRSSSSESDIESHSYSSAFSDYSVSCATKSDTNDLQEQYESRSNSNEGDVESHYSYSSAFSDYSASCTTRLGINDLQEQYESRGSSSESDIENHYSYSSAFSDYSVSCTTKSDINDLQEQYESRSNSSESDIESHHSYSSVICTTKSGINDFQEQYEISSSSSEASEVNKYILNPRKKIKY